MHEKERHESGHKHVTGTAVYIDDIPEPAGTLHAYLGLSPGLDFETRLFAKPNAAELLKATLAKRGYCPKPIAMGTNTDPYQPIERDYRITRQILEVCLETRHPVTITTKSDRVLDDADLKQAVERRSPRDLSPISAETAPVEVQPLVDSLNRLFALVNAQTEAQRRFVADAAHQLRTPLAGLQSQVEAWAQAARSLGGGDMLSLRADQVLRLRDATRRTSQLANQLLALSRADALSADAQPLHQVDLKDLCENILALYLDAAAAKGIDLGLESQPAQTRGHAWLLRELLINLVDNAVKYTPDGGCITLRCGQERVAGVELAWIGVEDDGPGIPDDERDRVLQRFYRLQGSAGEGNGLGLAIADEIARAHHTQLQLRTGPSGRGLCVRVAFAAAPDPRAA